MTRRAGAATVAELLLVLALFALVLSAGAGLLLGQMQAARRQATTLRGSEAIRASRVILGSELRYLAPDDVASTSQDSMRLRGFRGGGVVCSSDSTRIGVDYRGTRDPAPHKDSVLLVSGSGAEEVVQVLASAGGACSGTGVGVDLARAPARTPVYALLFETASYHLSDGALRYRSGAGGRQPLTEAVFAAPAFLHQPPLLVVIDLRFRPDSFPDASGGVHTVRAQGLNRLPAAP